MKWPRWREEVRSLGLGVRRPGRLVLLAVVTVITAAVMSTCSMPTNAFSIQAQTDLVTVEPSCGRYLPWDRGPGRLPSTSQTAIPAPPASNDKRVASAQPAASAAGSVTLGFGPGTKLTLERLPDDSLRAVLEPSKLFEGCASRPEVAEYSLRTVNPRSRMETDEHREFGKERFRDLVIEFRASAPDPKESSTASTKVFTHALEGRVVLGAAVQHGGGWGASSTPILRSAELSARTREWLTGQSITVHAEKLDGGSIIDTLPCLEGGPSVADRFIHRWQALKVEPGLAPAPQETVCRMAMQAPAFGFVRPNKDGGLDVVTHVSTDRVGVTPHQGEMRQIYVTGWAYLKNSPFWLTLFAVLFFASNLAQALTSLSIWKAEPRSEELDDFGASPPLPPAPPPPAPPPVDHPRGPSSEPPA